jgi:hypothetical protein
MAQLSDAAAAAERIAAAHKRLLADPALQFSFTQAPKPPQIPEWAKALGRLLEAAAPAMKYIFWGGLILAAALLFYFIAREIIAVRWKRPDRTTNLTHGVAPWRPNLEAARALLEDADRLAAEGRFEAAAHLLLLRTIDDIRGRRPDLVRPALTSRDIGALSALPEAARPAFALIAQVVERSLFGGQNVDADAFGRCRDAYADFALPKVWA